MRITADTNLVVRLLLRDDPAQTARAVAELDGAAEVVVPLIVFCEIAWVLRVRGMAPARIATALREVLAIGNIVVDRSGVAAGLDLLDAGGDFADGVIAAEGERLGAEVFVSFDRRAVRLLRGAGVSAREPGGA